MFSAEISEINVLCFIIEKAKYSNIIQDLVVIDLVSINADDSFIIV